MNPFDSPPATPPVSFDAPLSEQPSGSPRNRGRMALVALAAAGLVGGGLVGVSQLVSADRPSASDRASLAAIDAPDDDGDVEPDEPTDLPVDDGDEGDAPPAVDGEIVIDPGDGEPIVIDLGDIDEEALGRFGECVGLPPFGRGPLFDLELGEGELPFEDFELGEGWPHLEEFLDGLPLDDVAAFSPDGTHITVLGPDGLSVIELGEGDGSVTITQQDGDVTISTDGSATVRDLPALLDDLSTGPFAEHGDDLDDLPLDELFDDLPLDELFDDLPLDEIAADDLFELPDPAEIEACLDDLVDG